MAFYTTFIYLLGLVFLLNYSFIKKLLSFVLIVSITLIIFLVSPTIVDRHYQQTKDQLKFNFGEDNIFDNFLFYKDIYKTASNGYLDSKIFGQGARSFRFFCSEQKLASYTVSNYSYNFQDSLSIEKLNIKKYINKKMIMFLKNILYLLMLIKMRLKIFI